MENEEKIINGKIYAIKSLSSPLVYIGSTTTELDKRFKKHKENYKMYNNGNYHYVTSFELLKFEDCYITLLETIACTKKQLLILEGETIIKTVNVVNHQIAGNSIKYVNTSEYDKHYREKNKEKIKLRLQQYGKEHYKEYYERNKDGKFKSIDCECGGSYILKLKTRHLETKKHKEYITNI